MKYELTKATLEASGFSLTWTIQLTGADGVVIEGAGDTFAQAVTQATAAAYGKARQKDPTPADLGEPV